MTPEGRSVLAMEARMWHYRGAKAEAIRRDLGMTETRYAQVLNGLLDDPEALAADPVTVYRLRRIRQARLDERNAGLRLLQTD